MSTGGGAASTPATVTIAGRSSHLDAVRAFAILLVIGYHASFRFPGSEDDVVLGVLHGSGWIGVDMFFALSGFLIAKILLRDAADKDIRGFFIRRFFRIVPIFVVAVIAYGTASAVTGREAEILDRLWLSQLMLAGWVIPWFGVDGVPFTISWSLSVEEFAYIALGIAAARGAAMFRYAAMAFLVVALLVRWGVVLSGAFPLDRLYYFVPARLDAIALGAFGALGYLGSLVTSKRSSIYWGGATVALVVCYSFVPIRHWFLPVVGYGIFGLCAAAWVTSLAKAGDPQSGGTGKVLSAAATIGRVSYFMYLFHLFFIELVLIVSRETFGVVPSFWPGVIGSTIACYLCARLSWRYFESPMIIRNGRRTNAAY